MIFFSCGKNLSFFSSFPFIIHYSSQHFYLKKNASGMNVIIIILSNNITTVIVKALTMPGIIIFYILTHFKLITNFYSRYHYYLHFTDRAAETQGK